MTDTQYDRSVAAAKETFKKEQAEREKAEKLERYRENHKAAARIWFNALEEVWPPENTEGYWMKASQKFRQLYEGNSENALLKTLLVATYGYLGDVANDAEGKK